MLLIDKPSLLGESILAIVKGLFKCVNLRSMYICFILLFFYFVFSVDVITVVILKLKSAMLTLLETTSVAMMKSSETGDDGAKSIMDTTLNMIKLLLYCHKHVTIKPDHLRLCMCIVSMPWISKVSSEYANVVPCVDEWNFAKLKKLSHVIAKEMDCDVCFEVLAMFPPEFSRNWKVHVFKETLVCIRQ